MRIIYCKSSSQLLNFYNKRRIKDGKKAKSDNNMDSHNNMDSLEF